MYQKDSIKHRIIFKQRVPYKLNDFLESLCVTLIMFSSKGTKRYTDHLPSNIMMH